MQLLNVLLLQLTSAGGSNLICAQPRAASCSRAHCASQRALRPLCHEYQVTTRCHTLLEECLQRVTTSVAHHTQLGHRLQASNIQDSHGLETQKVPEGPEFTAAFRLTTANTLAHTQ